MHSVTQFAGFGLGLRRDHYRDFLEGEVAVDFVEVISENFMVDGGRPLRILEQVRAKHPVILHGVSMSIGSAHGLDRDHLARLRALADRIDPLWVSDHLCWTRTSAHNSHDLLPMPLTRDALDLVCDNIDHAQSVLGRALLFENPSSYLSFPQDEFAEWQFLAEMSRRRPKSCEQSRSDPPGLAHKFFERKMQGHSDPKGAWKKWAACPLLWGGKFERNAQLT